MKMKYTNNLSKTTMDKNLLRIWALVCMLCFTVQCNSPTDSNKKGQNIQGGVPVRVGPEGHSSSFSYYNTCPESPDGSKVAYVVFDSIPKEERSEKVSGKLWVCEKDLTRLRKVVGLNAMLVHNGGNVQWVDDTTIAYQDDSVRMVSLDGIPLTKPVAGKLGHEPFNQKILYSAVSEESGYDTIFEMDKTGEITALANVMDFKGVARHFGDENFKDVSEWAISHPQYSPDGEKIAFRLDVGPALELYKHLVTIDRSVGNIHYFGPKPMHFLWYDNESFIGHDHQVEDGTPNDKTLKRWDLEGTFLETLADKGNHSSISPDRKLFASESWYQEIPIVLKVYQHGQMEAFWQDTVSLDKHTTWHLAFHTNPSFSRDGKRLYYNKCISPGKVQTYMVELPNVPALGNSGS